MQDKDTKDDKKDSAKLIGENTYGLGVMGKYSWTLVLSLTAALSVVAMTIFRPGKEGWQNREKFIERLRQPAEWIREKANEFSNRNDQKLQGVIPVVGASFLLATIIKHVLQVPAFVRGKIQARKANEKYAMVVDENTELAEKLAKYESGVQPQEQTTTMSASTSLQKPVSEEKSGEVPPLRFLTENKPAESHAAAVQERKGNSSLVGTGV